MTAHSVRVDQVSTELENHYMLEENKCPKDLENEAKTIYSHDNKQQV